MVDGTRSLPVVSRRRLIGGTAGFAAGLAAAHRFPAGFRIVQADGGSLTYWTHRSDNDPNRAAQTAVVDGAFATDHPDVEITWEAFPDDLETKVRAASAAGTPPDMTDVFGAMSEFVANGWLRPAPEAFQTKATEASLPSAIDPAMFDGKLYGSTLFFGLPVGYIMVNALIAQEAGLDLDNPPTTWDGWGDWGQAMAKQADGALSQLGLGMGIYAQANSEEQTNRFLSLLWSAGGEAFDPGVTTPLFNSPAGTQALQILADLYQKYGVADRGFIADEEAMYTGRAGAWIASSFWGGYIKTGDPLPDELKETVTFRFYPLPAIVSSVALARPSFVGVMADDDASAELAWDLIDDWFEAYRTAETPLGAGNYVPWFKGQQEREPWRSDPEATVGIAAAATARPLPRSPRWAELSDAIGTQIYAAIVGDASVADALAEAEKRCSSILKA